MLVYLDDVNHGVLEEDEVHGTASYGLVVLTHEHLESRVQRLIVRQLPTQR